MDAGTFVLGLLNGLTYGLLAIGLVLIYRSNRFLNLSHGMLGLLSSQILAKLVIDDGWSWWAAFAVSLPLGILIGLAVDRWAIRPLRERRASPVAMLLVTVGITQLLIGLSFLRVFSADGNKLALRGYPLPFDSHVRVGGVVLDGSDILTAIAVPVLVLALTAFLRGTVLGKTIRAAATNPDAARLCGVSVRRVSMVVWGIAGGLSALTAILQARKQPSFAAAALGPNLLFLALGAAALAAFLSIPLAMAGGVLIGLAQQIAYTETSSAPDSEVVVFLLVIAIVLVRGKAIGEAFTAGGSAFDDRPPLRVSAIAEQVFWIKNRSRIMPAVALAAAALAPLVPVLSSEGRRFQLCLVAVYALAGLSLTVALGWAGQISLGHFALLGAGAFVGARLLERSWTLPFVIIVAGLLGAALIIVIGAPALRVPGLTLAVTTLGFALVGPDWLFRQNWFGSTSAFGVLVDPPLLGQGLGRPSGRLVVYYVAIGFIVLSALALASLRRTQLGRSLIAVRDNAAAAATFGFTPATIKVAALGLSGFLVGAAGVLWADAWRYATTTQFGPELSFALLALPVIGGVGSIGGAIAAAVLFEGSTFFVAPHLGWLFGSAGSSIGFQLMLAGAGITIAVLKTPGGLAAIAQTWLQRRIDRLDTGEPAVWSRPSHPTLVADAVTRSFGGIRALAGASIEVRPGEIVGLIGPNGAGKTTLLNVLSGALAGDGGSVRLGDLEITDLPPDMRAQLGLSRSFQDARLFAGLTVRETVQLAVGKQRSAGILASASNAPWVRSAERDTRTTAEAIIERLGLAGFAGSLTSSLSTGTRRICDLAAQVAAKPSVVLLDEPTAGVAQREAEAFGPLLRRIRDELDCAILIVEHDMPLLMGLCDRVYAMESGTVIAEGTPDEIRANPQVIASYLGTNEAAVGRSGRGSRTTTASNGARTGTRKRSAPSGQRPAATVRPAARTSGSAP